MHCWKCGKEIEKDSQKCLYCGSALIRKAPATETGKVLRKIYDDYGSEKVLGDSRYITLALSDFIPDSELLKRNIDLVFYMGLGAIYLTQLEKSGKPDEAFYKRVKRIITEEADISDKKADQLIFLFDEMIGWDSSIETGISSIQESQVDEKLVDKESVVQETDEEISLEETDPIVSEPAKENTDKLESLYVSDLTQQEDFRPKTNVSGNKTNVVEEKNASDNDSFFDFSTMSDAYEPVKKELIFSNVKNEESQTKIQSSNTNQKVNDEEDKKSFEKKRNIVVFGFCLITIVALIAVISLVISFDDNQSKKASFNDNQSERTITSITANVGDIIKLGVYEQDSDNSNGKEEIEWLVLAKNGNKALVISKKILDCQSYNSEIEYVTWANCSLRKWLNGSFYNTAFNSSEQNRINSTVITTRNNSAYNLDNQNNTNDYVFLLSSYEAENYFYSNSARKCEYTAYSYSTTGDRSFWWLRSHGNMTSRAAFVSSDGKIYADGQRCDIKYGVRPAMWITVDG